VLVRIQRLDYVVRETVLRGERGEMAVSQADQSAAVGADPEAPVLIFDDGTDLRRTNAGLPGIVVDAAILPPIEAIPGARSRSGLIPD